MNIVPSALLVDMDGTLTDPRQPVTNDVLEILRKTGPGVKRYLVTGSDFAKVEEQMGNDNLLKLFERVYACNGTRVWNCNIDMDDEVRPCEPQLIHKPSLTDYYSEADINHIINFLLETAYKTHTKIKTGTFVEWRDSQINFSVVGRNCTTEQRDNYVKWDKKSGEREKIINQLRQQFKGWGLSFRLGGQISIDITREGWDKTYGLKHFQGWDVWFVGDRCLENGNDYEIYNACGKQSYKSTGPVKTTEIINDILKRIQGGGK